MPKKKKSFIPGDFKLAVKKSRTGKGLFAMEPIPKGACIIEYVGRLLTDEEYDRSESLYLFDIGRNKVLDGSARTNKARYINHSCDPNCEADLHKRRPYIHAIRDIEPGEELAYNYGEEYFDEYLGKNCLCLKCSPIAAVSDKASKKSKAAKKTEPKKKAKAKPDARKKKASEKKKSKAA